MDERVIRKRHKWTKTTEITQFKNLHSTNLYLLNQVQAKSPRVFNQFNNNCHLSFYYYVFMKSSIYNYEVLRTWSKNKTLLTLNWSLVMTYVMFLFDIFILFLLSSC